MTAHQIKMYKEVIYILTALGLLVWQPSATNGLLALIVIIVASYFRDKGN